ncbi:Retrotransposon-derived protein PEG10 [Smittium culicis]|uniref:Retrotransposon-derived protein PEG10 n=1 Tax=Smittium culicis TaxID=133412 RepID=A0A1R1X0R6_9FUNG|nr:Retrotransposon-derived protein PEG10 [Smittium culicis]
MKPTPRQFFPSNQEPQEQNQSQFELSVQMESNEQMDAQSQRDRQEFFNTMAQNPAIHNIPPAPSPFQAFHIGSSKAEDSIRIPDAPKFDGNPTKFEEFMNSMEIMFYIKPEIFSIDRNRVAYIGTHLLGSASKWFGSLITSASPHIYSYDSFIVEFKRNFSDPNIGIRVRGLIRKCRQGSKSVSEYSSEFKALARDSGLNQLSLVDEFLRGLNSNIARLLVVSDLTEA